MARREAAFRGAELWGVRCSVITVANQLHFAGIAARNGVIGISPINLFPRWSEAERRPPVNYGHYSAYRTVGNDEALAEKLGPKDELIPSKEWRSV